MASSPLRRLAVVLVAAASLVTIGFVAALFSKSPRMRWLIVFDSPLRWNLAYCGNDDRERNCVVPPDWNVLAWVDVDGDGRWDYRGEDWQLPEPARCFHSDANAGWVLADPSECRAAHTQLMNGPGKAP